MGENWQCFAGNSNCHVKDAKDPYITDITHICLYIFVQFHSLHRLTCPRHPFWRCRQSSEDLSSKHRNPRFIGELWIGIRQFWLWSSPSTVSFAKAMSSEPIKGKEIAWKYLKHSRIRCLSCKHIHPKHKAQRESKTYPIKREENQL